MIDFRDLSKCGGCSLNQTNQPYMKFQVVGHEVKPQVLILAEAPTQEDMAGGAPLSGPEGKLFRDVIGKVTQSYAIAYLVSCVPPGERKITDEDRKYCAYNLNAILEELRPKKVILLGMTVSSMILPSLEGKAISKYAKTHEESVGDIRYYPVFHPKFILNRGGETAKEYGEYCDRIRRIVTGEKVEFDIDYKLVETDDLIYTIREFQEADLDTGFDYETTGLPWKGQTRVLGIGFANIRFARYIKITRPLTEEETRVLLEYMHSLRSWVYNVKFEMNMTWQWLGVYIEFNDAHVLCKIEGSPINLKDNATRFLGISKWNSDVETLTEIFEKIFKYKRIDFVDPDLKDYLSVHSTSDYDFEELQKGKDKTTLNYWKLCEKTLGIISLEELREGLATGNRFAAVPPRIMGLYCAQDAYYTILINNKLWSRTEPFYPYYHAQALLAGVMEGFALPWSESKAEELAQFYDKESLTSLRNLLLHQDFFLGLTDEEKMNIATSSDIEVLKGFFNPNSNHENTYDKFFGYYSPTQWEPRLRDKARTKSGKPQIYQLVMEKKGKKLREDHRVVDATTIPGATFPGSIVVDKAGTPVMDEMQQFIYVAPRLVTQTGKGFIVSPKPPIDKPKDKSEYNTNKYVTLDSLKPEEMPNIQQELVVQEVYQHPIDFRWVPNFYTDKVKGCLSCDYIARNVAQLEGDFVKHLKDLSYETFTSVIESLYLDAGSDVVRGEIYKIIDYGVKTYPEENSRAFNTGVMTNLYNALTRYGGVDIDKEETWGAEFSMLFHFRRYKKIMKSLSTYINGSVGRESVHQTEYPKELKQPPIRNVAYEVSDKSPASDYVVETSFFDCAADTRRWRSKIHTIPWNCELREIFVPRSPTSILAHFDYAQAEVRCIARLAGEESMLQAFRDGIDIHRANASKMYGKPLEEITDAERRDAKSGTFALLYGSTIEGFAIEQMNGDVAGARKLFADFYAAFPKLKAWIDEQHRSAKENGYVLSIFGDKIYLDSEQGEASMLRTAQNYPVQHAGSNLAGYAIYNLWKAIYDFKIDAIPMIFTHDSSDWDVELKHLLLFIQLTYQKTVVGLQDEFQVPAGIDFDIGVTQNDVISLELTDKLNVFEFSSTKEAFPKVLSHLETEFKVDYEVEKEKAKYEPMSDLFLSKRAFSKYLGMETTKVSGTIEIQPR